MAGVATARMGSVSHAPLPRAMFGATIEEGNMGKEKGSVAPLTFTYADFQRARKTRIA